MTKKNSNKQTVEAFNKEKQALEAQVRELQVKNILSVVPFETEEKRTKVLQGLVNSNVTIDFIPLKTIRAISLYFLRFHFQI